MARPFLPSPERWTRTTLDPNPACGFILKVDSGGTPSTSKEEYWDGDVPWLTPKEITRRQNHLYISHTARTITEAGMKASAAKLLPPDTVMLTKRAPVGAVAMNAVPMTTNQGFLNFQCGPLLRPLFLAQWMLVNRRYLRQIANGSTYLELYKSDLFEFELAVPPLDEQEAILEAIRAVQFSVLIGDPLEQSLLGSADTHHIQEQTRSLEAIQRHLTLGLLSGQLRPSSVATLTAGIGGVSA